MPGELLELDVRQITVRKCMAKKAATFAQGWKTLVRNHAEATASTATFVVPRLHHFNSAIVWMAILRHLRRELSGPHAEFRRRLKTQTMQRPCCSGL